MTKPRVPADRLQLGLEFIRFQLSREMPGPGPSTRTVYEEIEAALVELQERRTADEPSGDSVMVKLPTPPYEFRGDSGKIECPMCAGEGSIYPPVRTGG